MTAEQIAAIDVWLKHWRTPGYTYLDEAECHVRDLLAHVAALEDALAAARREPGEWLRAQAHAELWAWAAQKMHRLADRWDAEHTPTPEAPR